MTHSSPVSARSNPADFARHPLDICVIAFSHDHGPVHDHFSIIQRCLSSIIDNTPAGWYRLHVGCNNLSPRAMALVDELVVNQAARKYLGAPARDCNGRTVYPKYPLMREIYRACSAPWTVWFDDDSYVIRADWLERLQETINNRPLAEQFGRPDRVLVPDEMLAWLARSRWFNPAVGLPESEYQGRRRVIAGFVLGGFYALSRKAIEACDIPDSRLFQDHGDWVTTLSLLHQGFRAAVFDYGVAIDTEPRRGMHLNQWVRPDDPVLADKEWADRR